MARLFDVTFALQGDSIALQTVLLYLLGTVRPPHPPEFAVVVPHNSVRMGVPVR